MLIEKDRPTRPCLAPQLRLRLLPVLILLGPLEDLPRQAGLRRLRLGRLGRHGLRRLLHRFGARRRLRGHWRRWRRRRWRRWRFGRRLHGRRLRGDLLGRVGGLVVVEGLERGWLEPGARPSEGLPNPRALGISEHISYTSCFSRLLTRWHIQTDTPKPCWHAGVCPQSRVQAALSRSHRSQRAPLPEGSC